jgi:hypothetical protein
MLSHCRGVILNRDENPMGQTELASVRPQASE